MWVISARSLVAAGAIALATGALAGCGGTDHQATTHNTSSPTASSSVAANAAFNEADAEFSTLMIPHHGQAIEMARLAATRAGNAEVRALAQRIEGAQQPEIDMMSNWLREWGKPVPNAADMGGHGHASMPGMMSDADMGKLKATKGTDFDRMFLEMMIVHHEGAIQMAETEQRQGQDSRAKGLAAKVAEDQTAEIEQMRALLAKL